MSETPLHDPDSLTFQVNRPVLHYSVPNRSIGTPLPRLVEVACEGGVRSLMAVSQNTLPALRESERPGSENQSHWGMSAPGQCSDSWAVIGTDCFSWSRNPSGASKF